MTPDHPRISDIAIVDPLDLQKTAAIEVEITLADGSQRRCYFCTHRAMDQFGDWNSDTRVRFHYGSHMIILGGEISDALVKAALADIERNGDLMECTQPVGN